MRGNPANRLIPAIGDHQLKAGMTEERVLGRINQFEQFAAQLWDAVRSSRSKALTNVYKNLALRLVGYRCNYYFLVGHMVTQWMLLFRFEQLCVRYGLLVKQERQSTQKAKGLLQRTS